MLLRYSTKRLPLWGLHGALLTGLYNRPGGEGGGGAVTLIKKNYLDLGCLSRGFLCIVICCVVSVPAACAVQESQSDRATNDTDG